MCRRRSTATASAAATRTWSPSSPTSRSRRDQPAARRRRRSAPEGALSRSVAEIVNHVARTTTSRTSAGRRSPTRAASTVPRWRRSSGATSTSTRPPSATSAGWSCRSSAAAPTRPSVPAAGPRARGTSTRPSFGLIKRLENEGLAFEGAEASFELLIRRTRPGYAAPFRLVDYTCARGAARPARAPRRGDGQGRGRRRGPPHGRRRQRPGQRARRRAAQGAAGVLPGPRRGPPRRLQGPHPRRRRRDGRPHAGHHRLAGRLDDLVHDGQRHEHHRGLGAALADSLEYAIWKTGAELRRRDERHFTTTNGQGTAAAASHEPDPAAAGGPS